MIRRKLHFITPVQNIYGAFPQKMVAKNMPNLRKKIASSSINVCLLQWNKLSCSSWPSPT